jgi:hypothetical protein
VTRRVVPVRSSEWGGRGRPGVRSEKREGRRRRTRSRNARRLCRAFDSTTSFPGPRYRLAAIPSEKSQLPVCLLWHWLTTIVATGRSCFPDGRPATFGLLPGPSRATDGATPKGRRTPRYCALTDHNPTTSHAPSPLVAVGLRHQRSLGIAGRGAGATWPGPIPLPSDRTRCRARTCAAPVRDQLARHPPHSKGHTSRSFRASLVKGGARARSPYYDVISNH